MYADFPKKEESFGKFFRFDFLACSRHFAVDYRKCCVSLVDYCKYRELDKLESRAREIICKPYEPEYNDIKSDLRKIIQKIRITSYNPTIMIAKQEITPKTT